MVEEFYKLCIDLYIKIQWNIKNYKIIIAKQAAYFKANSIRLTYFRWRLILIFLKKIKIIELTIKLLDHL